MTPSTFDLARLPGLVALGGENAGELLRQTRDVVAQGLQILLDILGAGRGDLAGLLDSASLPYRVPYWTCSTCSLLRHCLEKSAWAANGPRAKKFHLTREALLRPTGKVVEDHQAMIDSGTARNAPIGPHSQAQNTIAVNTISGLSVSRWPRIVGVMMWPSIVVSADEGRGGSSA